MGVLLCLALSKLLRPRHKNLISIRRTPALAGGAREEQKRGYSTTNPKS